LEIHGSVANYGKDFASFLEGCGTISPGHRLIRRSEADGMAKRHFGLRTATGKYSTDISSQGDVLESIEPRIDYDCGQR
jgi:hypothetical protein